MYECEWNGPSHLTNSIVKISFEGNLRSHEVCGHCGPRACTKKDAENDASIRVIKHQTTLLWKI